MKELNRHQSGIVLSPVTEARFGVRAATYIADVDRGSFANALAFCEEEQVQLLVARCKSDDLVTVQAMERQGFLLMDTLLYCRHRLKIIPEARASAAHIRPIQPGEEKDIGAITRSSFAGYFGHFHADEHLDNMLCDEVYVDWSMHLASKPQAADEMIVVELNGRLVGYMALSGASGNGGELVLSGVLTEAQGQGIYWNILVASLQWCQQQGYEYSFTSTQITNQASFNAFLGVGYRLWFAYYTFHKWFNRS